MAYPIKYGIDEILLNLRETPIAILLIMGLLANAGFFIQYIEGIRLGFRDRTHGVPTTANMYFFAHDIGFVLLFRRWMFEIDHWFFKMFWVAILVFTVLEAVVHYQTLRFSRAELMPRLSQRQYVVAYIAAQLAVGALFWFITAILDDYAYLFLFTTTVIACSAFNLTMLVGRGSQKGQSPLLAAGPLIGATAFFFGLMPLLAAAFRSPVFLATGVGVTLANVIYLLALRTYPRTA